MALDLFGNSCTEDEVAGFFNNSAVQASKSGKPEDALKLYQSALKALKTNRYKTAVHYNIALAYVDLKQFKEALNAVNSALKFDKKHDKSLRLKEKLEKSEKLAAS